MDSRLLFFLAIACAVSRIDGQDITTFSGNITRSGCGSTKLCPADCDPSVNVTTSTCFFASSQLKGSTTLFFELSGTTPGYVGLGLGNTPSQGPSIVFVCGNNVTANSTFFFRTATNSSNGLNTSGTVNTVYTVQGAVTGNQTLNQTLIQCTFNTSSTLNFTTKSAATAYYFYILSGTVSGDSLGFAAIQYFSNKLLDLTSPSGNITNTSSPNTTTTTAKPTTSGNNALANPLAHALAILLSAIGLLLLY